MKIENLQILKKNKQKYVKLEGHTDKNMNSSYNHPFIVLI